MKSTICCDRAKHFIKDKGFYLKMISEMSTKSRIQQMKNLYK
jgi:hypothetical protein